MDPRPSPATLSPSTYVDTDHPAVRELARRVEGSTDRERAVSAYHLVRDGFRYDPYRIDLGESGMKASTVAQQGYGWCVTKSALLAAVARLNGIPARLGYADVRNHLSTARLREMLKTDMFIWHGFTELWVDGKWVKATPAFNIELCERFGLHPLEFDGTADSIYHPFDRAGNRHMEYVQMRGSYDDIPRERIMADFAEFYPVAAWLPASEADAFQKDVEQETKA